MVLKFLKKSYKKVSSSVGKTGSTLGRNLKQILNKNIDDKAIEELEKLFFEADLGTATATELVDKVKELAKNHNNPTPEFLLDAIKKELVSILKQYPHDINTPPKTDDPTVILVIGVNGNGKTTSVAKLAHMYRKQNKQVLIAAADTFRAAATEQIAKWAGITDADIVKGNNKSDPSAVVFDAISAAKARNSDVVIIDTAGRLHTKTHLMQELGKIHRVCTKVIPEAPHETLLVIDSTVGQNAIDQALQFNQHTPITGIILTKLDGTAKGGIVISIQRQLKTPIKFVGTGEQADDIEIFDPEKFVNNML